MFYSFEIASPSFVGPIELLLDLVRKRKLHISEVSLAIVADSFLLHFESMPSMPVESASRFLGVVSTLVYIKSKQMLPNEGLIDHKQEKEASALLERVKLLDNLKVLVGSLLINKKDYYVRPGFKGLKKVKQELFLPKGVFLLVETIDSLISKNNSLIAKTVDRKLKARYIKPRLALAVVKDKLKADLAVVKDSYIILNNWLLEEVSTIGDYSEKKDFFIASFLSTLEMVKTNEVLCEQSKPFADIMIKVDYGK